MLISIFPSETGVAYVGAVLLRVTTVSEPREIGTSDLAQSISSAQGPHQVEKIAVSHLHPDLS